MRETEPDQPKKRRLIDLIPDKLAVQTSLGTLFVRWHTVTEFASFADEPDVDVLGRAALCLLTSKSGDKSDKSVLTEAEAQALSPEDVRALAKAVLKVNTWGDLPEPGGFRELGQAIKAAHASAVEKEREQAARLQERLKANYGHLDPATFDKLARQMGGAAAMSATLGLETGIVAAALRDKKLVDDAFGGSVARQAMESALRDVQPLSGMLDARRELDAAGTFSERVLASTPSYQQPQIQHFEPLRPEDTPLGRAALESAENTREALDRMEVLVGVISGLNQTIVNDLLPEWSRQIKEDQKGAKEAFEQAGESLKWAKVAVFVSVFLTLVVTLGATWWQIAVAHEIDDGNTLQVKQLQAIMEKQLAAQQKLIEQQAGEAAALRKEIASFAQAASAAAAAAAAPVTKK